MRFAGIGLIVVGAAIAVAGGVGAGDAAGTMLAAVLGGFLFVAGAIFTATEHLRQALLDAGRNDRKF